MLESNKKRTKVLFEETDILLGPGDRAFEPHYSDQNPSEIVDFRGIFLFFVYCGAYSEMDTHTLRETSCIVQHSNRFSIHLYKYNSVEFVVEWEYNIY